MPLSPPEVDSLLDGVGPGQIAVSLTAKAGMRPEHYVEVLEHRWERLSPQEPADAPATGAAQGAARETG